MGRSRLHGIVISAEGAGIPKKCAHETSLAGGACGGERLQGLRVEVRAVLTRRRSPDLRLREAGLSTAQGWLLRCLEVVEAEYRSNRFEGKCPLLDWLLCCLKEVPDEVPVRFSPRWRLLRPRFNRSEDVSWAVYLDKLRLDGEGASFVGLPACLPFLPANFCELTSKFLERI